MGFGVIEYMQLYMHMFVHIKVSCACGRVPYATCIGSDGLGKEAPALSLSFGHVVVEVALIRPQLSEQSLAGKQTSYQVAGKMDSAELVI